MTVTIERSELPALAEVLDGLPNFSGWESDVLEVVQNRKACFPSNHQYSRRRD